MTSSSKKPPEPNRAASYARFIPREELTSFASWLPGALDGQPPRAATGRPAGAPAAAAPVAEPAPPPPPSLEVQLRQAHDRGYQDGYRDGLAALDVLKQQLAAQYAAQVGALVTALDAQFDALQAQLAPRLAEVAITLARQVVHHEIRERPEVVVAVVQEALEALVHSARRVIVRVHPDDLPLVQAGAGELLAAREARLLPDEQIEAGGCLVESDIGIVDAGVGASWQRALAAIGHDAHHHPLHPPPSAPAPKDPSPAADALAPSSLSTPP